MERPKETPNSIYKPLDTEGFEIRLLQIPFSMYQYLGKHDPKPIRGKLVHYKLPNADAPVARKVYKSVTRRLYVALSYVWGDTSERAEIFVDGQALSITKSLYTGLRQLQNDAMSETWVWVDAICINQEDDAEKSAQIRLMRQVYRNASNVRIWLGPADGEEDEIFRCLEFVSTLSNGYMPDKHVPSENPDWADVHILSNMIKPVGLASAVTLSAVHKIRMSTDVFKNQSADAKADLLSNSNKKEYIKPFSSWKPKPKDLEKALKLLGEDGFAGMAKSIERNIILNSEWFSRIWVVQEVGVALSDVEISRGPYGGDWSYLLNAIFYLHYTCKIPFPSIDKVVGLETIRAAFWEGKRSRLRDLMYECRYRHASNPRDKIYGLYGLMGDRINEFLQPDYSKLVEEVYAHTTFHFITQAQSLDPICGQQFAQRNKNLPSWAPDFELDLSLAPAPLLAPDYEETIFSASGSDVQSKYELPDPQLSLIEWSILPTQGLYIGSVAMISQLAEADDSLCGIEQTWGKTLDHYLDNVPTEGREAIICSLDQIADIVKEYSEQHTAFVAPTVVYSPKELVKVPRLTGDTFIEDLARAMGTPITQEDESLPLPPRLSTNSLVIRSKLADGILDSSDDTVEARPTLPPRSSRGRSTSSFDKKQLVTEQSNPVIVPNPTSSSYSIPQSSDTTKKYQREANISSQPTRTNSSFSFTNANASIIDFQNPLVVAYLETLFTGRQSPSKRTTLSYLKHVFTDEDDVNQSTSTLDLKQSSSSTSDTTGDDQTSKSESDTSTIDPISPTNSKIRQALEAGMRRRRFIITSNGEFGAGPEEAQIGDLVVVLFGCSVPVVLRKAEKLGNREDESRYRFIGECYVNGFMDAEAIAWMVRGRYKVQDFMLV